MKLNLGRFILLFLFTTLSQASEYEWHVQVNKKEAHVNEAIHLHYSCDYSDSAELYVIEFNPTIDNKNYKIEILSFVLLLLLMLVLFGHHCIS